MDSNVVRAITNLVRLHVYAPVVNFGGTGLTPLSLLRRRSSQVKATQ